MPATPIHAPIASRLEHEYHGQFFTEFKTCAEDISLGSHRVVVLDDDSGCAEFVDMSDGSVIARVDARVLEGPAIVKAWSPMAAIAITKAISSRPVQLERFY